MIMTWAVISYLIGAIPFSFLVGKFRGVNLLEVGSKSSGATNVYRTLGLGWAMVAFLLDMGKGYVAAYGAHLLNPGGHSYVVMCALLAIVGHTLTPFLRFKGGKGVATGLGVLIFIQPLIALTAFILEISIILITRYVSVGSIVAGLSVVLLSWLPFFALPMSYRLLLLIAVVYIIYKHIPNMKRLAKGQENKI